MRREEKPSETSERRLYFAGDLGDNFKLHKASPGEWKNPGETMNPTRRPMRA